MRKQITCLVLVVLLAVPVHSLAGYVKVKAKGESPEGGLFGLSDGDKAKAVFDAKKKAILKFTSHFESARLKLFEPLLEKVLANLDEYVPEVEIISSEKNQATKRYEVIVEASVDESRLERLIAENVAKAGKPGEKAGEPLAMTFLFVARETQSVKTFQERVTDKMARESSGSAQESDGVSEDAGTYRGEYKKVDEVAVTTGGSTLRQADEIQYAGVATVSEVDAKVTEVFSKADIQVTDPADVGVDVAALKKQFAVGSDISGEVRKAALDACRAAGVDLVAIGTMDTGVADKDAATGLSRVYVTVTAKITDLRKKLPVSVASIGPIQFAGLGTDAQVAKRNALIESATKATKDLVDQLRSKGLI